MDDKEKDTTFNFDEIIEATKALQGLRAQQGVLDDACEIDKEILKGYLEDL